MSAKTKEMKTNEKWSGEVRTIPLGGKCECGFKFAGAGEFRNCDAFVTKEGKGGIVCPDCGRRYIVK